jgi:hypothetical protein
MLSLKQHLKAERIATTSPRHKSAKVFHPGSRSTNYSNDARPVIDPGREKMYAQGKT